jgi:uncharacterized protein (TIGR02145 family)
MKVVSFFCILFLTFQTLHSQSNGKIEFTEIKIGSQVWADKNLSVTTFMNGDPIPQIKTQEEWLKAFKMKTPGWCYYDNKIENGSKYGIMYNWYAVNDSRKLAPTGWHISTSEDWDTLARTLKQNSGVKLKSQSGWNGGGVGTDIFGFNSLPGGYRSDDSYNKSYFFGIGDYVNYWTTDKSNSSDEWSKYRSLRKDNTVLEGNASNRNHMYYVRCVKDKTQSIQENITSNSKTIKDQPNKLSNTPIIKANNSIAHVDFNVENTLISQKQNIDKALKEYDSLLNQNEEIIQDLIKYIVPNYSENYSKGYYDLLYRPYNEIKIKSIKESLKPIYDKILNGEAYLLINRDNLPYSKKNTFLFNNNLKNHIINDSLLFFVTSDNLMSKEIGIISRKYNNMTVSLELDRFGDAPQLNKIIRNLIRLSKKNKSFLLVKNEGVDKVARTFIGVDTRYFELLKQYESINDRLKLLRSKFIIELNSTYYYFGEKTDSYTKINPSDAQTIYIAKNKDKSLYSPEGIQQFIQANGFGYIIFNRKQNTPIVLSGNWVDGYPTEILETSLYEEMPYNQNLASLKLKKYNSNNQLHIDENGLIFGEYQGNGFHGTAFRLWKNASYYYGSYQNGFRTEGVLIWANGDKYKGSFNSSGYKHGYGSYFWKDGSNYVGEWKNDVMAGYGIQTNPNGTVSEGIWGNNRLIKSKAEIEQERIIEEQRREQERIAEEQRKRQEEAEKERYNKAIQKMVLEILSQPSIFSSSSSSSSLSSSSSSSSNKGNCYSCSGTGKCRQCNKVFKSHYWGGKYKGWKSDSETRLGYVICSECKGSGVKYGLMDDNNEPTSKPCYVSSCRNGWIYCTECNYNGNGSHLGSCKKCKGSGTSK